MEYLDPNEIRKSSGVKERQKNFVGPDVRHGFTLAVVEKYAKQISRDRERLNVLDCGTSSGQFFSELSEVRFRNLYGIDIDDYLKPENKSLTKEFKTADLSYEKIPWGDGFFDLLTGWCIMPHLENPFNFIREAHRVLKTGGLLIYSTINVASPSHRKYFSKHGDLPGYHERNNHISVLTPAIFKKTILRYFDLIGTEYFVNPRIFNGAKGRLRKFIYEFVSKNPKMKEFFDNRWGPKIIYVLRKREVIQKAQLQDE